MCAGGEWEKGSSSIFTLLFINVSPKMRADKVRLYSFTSCCSGSPWNWKGVERTHCTAQNTIQPNVWYMFTMHWWLSLVFSYNIAAVFTSSSALGKFDLQMKLYVKLFEGSFKCKLLLLPSSYCRDFFVAVVRRSQWRHHLLGWRRAVVRHRGRQRRRLDTSAQEWGPGGIRPHILRRGLFGN